MGDFCWWGNQTRQNFLKQRTTRILTISSRGLELDGLSSLDFFPFTDIVKIQPVDGSLTRHEQQRHNYQGERGKDRGAVELFRAAATNQRLPRRRRSLRGSRFIRKPRTRSSSKHSVGSSNIA